MPFRQFWPWVRGEVKDGLGRGRLARWLGRNWARLHYARSIEPTWLELNRFEIFVSDLPPHFAGLRILQMTDFHAGDHLDSNYLAEAVELAMTQHADVIALTGDYINHGSAHVRGVARILGELKAPLGVYGVLGNHDYSVRTGLGIRKYKQLHQAVHDALSDTGIVVLRNATQVLFRGNERLYVSGVDDLWSHEADLERTFRGMASNVPRILLAHNPCTVEILNGHRCDLMLSGHTHGGQVRLPGVGRIALGPKGRRYAAGMYHVHGCQLYVNKGVGFGWRVRYQVRPEIAIFTLLPKEPSESQPIR